MDALITGGAGFIGSHLADFLLARGDRVTVLDDLSGGSMENIAHLEGRAGFRCHIDSVTNRSLVAELVDQSTVVFHLAAAVGVQLIVESPVRSITTNIAGTEVLLQAAAKNRRKVLITSSSEVYGKRSEVPFSEEDDLLLGPPTRRRWGYACSKAANEFLALAYADEHGVPVIVARLFNTVGPRQTGRYGMVIPRFVHAALCGQPITVYGDGSQSRCFAYVGDVVRALAGLADQPKAIGGVVNVGSDEETRIDALAHQVKAQAASASDIVYVPYDLAYGTDLEDVQRRVPDLTRLERLLGERPRTRLRDILDSVIDDVRRRLLADSPDPGPAPIRLGESP
jgi:nucleoside-diphosphate-sugar epimerase